MGAKKIGILTAKTAQSYSPLSTAAQICRHSNTATVSTGKTRKFRPLFARAMIAGAISSERK